MGLDMYLRETRYLSHWSHSADTPEYAAGEAVLAAADLKAVPDSGVTVSATAIYWRKANAIHGWFVDNVQGGNDDCRKYDVSVEQLTELRNLCQQVLDNSKLVDGEITNGYEVEWVNGEMVKNPIIEPGKIIEYPSIALQLLPPRQGFFFGSDEPDEGYIYDLQETVQGIDRALANRHPDSWFEYESSW